MVGCPEVADLLIEAGVDLDAGGAAKMTALHKASERGRGEVVRALLEAGDLARAPSPSP